MKASEVFIKGYEVVLKQALARRGETIAGLAKRMGGKEAVYQVVRAAFAGRGSAKHVYDICNQLGIDEKEIEIQAGKGVGNG